MVKKISQILGSILALLALILLVLNRSKSSLEQEFKKDQEKCFKHSHRPVLERFQENQFKDYPRPIQNYIKQSGWVNQPLMEGMHLFFEGVQFKLGPGKPTMKMNYKITESARSPRRIAYIDGSLFALKFNGYDALLPHKVIMKGELLNHFSLFQHSNDDLLAGSLLSYLSEVFLMPAALLNQKIHFQALNDHKVLARIKQEDMELNGCFIFNDKAEMTCFITDDRPFMDMEGQIKTYRWKAECFDYRANADGIKLPNRLKASWLIGGKYFDYFDGKISWLTYF